MKFTDHLRKMNACPQAIEWVGRRGIRTAWRDCVRRDWMLWLLDALDVFEREQQELADDFKAQCDLIRKRIPVEAIEKAWRER